MLAKLRKSFVDNFEKIPQIFYAPGRVNIIGEHTDYNNGFVLPIAIDKGTYVAITPRTDNILNIISLKINESASLSLIEVLDISSDKTPHWLKYILGMIHLLNNKFNHYKGADIIIDSNLPIGAGLSSSSSLTIALGFAYCNVYNLEINLQDLASLAQKTENKYVDTQCGIMDQMTCAMAKKDHAFFLDCRSLDIGYISFMLKDKSLLIADTGVKHELSSSEYNNRRVACESVARFFKVDSLRDVTFEMLEQNKNEFNREVCRQAFHVVSENKRVLNAVKAMQKKDYITLGLLMTESHHSLQYDFLVSIAELDFLVDLAKNHKGVYGARMTGGGFGGCTIHLVDNCAVREYKQHLMQEYSKKFALNLKCYICKPSNGVEAIE